MYELRIQYLGIPCPRSGAWCVKSRWSKLSDEPVVFVPEPVSWATPCNCLREVFSRMQKSLLDHLCVRITSALVLRSCFLIVSPDPHLPRKRPHNLPDGPQIINITRIPHIFCSCCIVGLGQCGVIAKNGSNSRNMKMMAALTRSRTRHPVYIEGV